MYQGYPNPLDGILPSVKAALTKAYKEGSKTRMVRAADFVAIPGMKKAPMKRIAALLEPSDDVIGENNDDTLVQSEDENSSDTEDLSKFSVIILLVLLSFICSSFCRDYFSFR